MTRLNRRLVLTGAAAALAVPSVAAASAAAPRIVPLAGQVPAGQIHVVPSEFALYWTLPGREAVKYDVGVAPRDRWMPGTYLIRRKAEWPRWTPTPAMIRRDPDKYGPYAGGMPGGGMNPLGARALYLYENGRDTYLRIHGSPDNSGIGRRVSNGCVRMTNDDVRDLYARVPTDTIVVLHA
ncbi:L,D-transpeptidase [Pseudooctadecabacter sp.]|uniref:L,D-transpeptidase n=1 Tax=Pseudooctadecabacter sp. TaxID=1966338 RepID=UPI0025CC0D74|nr:L,D-transpeptidase [Pseudooctadecabacter sp.]